MPALNSNDKVIAARELSEKVLNDKGAFDESKRMRAKEIYAEAIKSKAFDNIIDIFPNEDSLGPYISFGLNKDGSNIVKPNGKQGYFFSKAQEIIQQREEKTEVKDKREEKKERDKEKILYPSLEIWLQAQGYKTKDTSQTKILGKWGNPDVSGLKTTDFIGTKEIEIITIEVKLSIENWEYNIFEAVAHRRFANRVYFAFSHPYSLVGSIPSNIRYYCELYGIGLIIISMSDDLYERCIRGEVSQLTDTVDYDITEKYSAPFNFIQAKWQKEFCAAVGIKEASDLYTWGNAISV